ncbi:MAG: cellulase family glycosylhydrolase [Saprospiraceae bacterium]|nr:cellulase family glycosylhydrolase [Saprospiraceae bacterium]
MRSNFKQVLFLFIVLTFLNAPIIKGQDLPWVKVVGNQFVDEVGNIIQFKGLNTSDPDKLDDEGQWSVEYFRQVKSWDINIVRFPIHPEAWRKRGKEAYFQLLDKGIEMARGEGLYVILDWHSIGNLRSEIYQHPRYNTTKRETFEFWIEMAQRYGNNPTVAMFELFNEPTLGGGRFGVCTWSEWTEIMKELIIIIRAHGAKNIPLVAGFNWAYDLTEVVDHPIDAEGIAYVSHPYPQKRDQPWEDKWEADFGHVADLYPVVLTEIGYCGENDEGAHIPVISDPSYVTKILDYVALKGMSYTVWVFDPAWSPMLIKDWDFNLTEPGKVWKATMKN